MKISRYFFNIIVFFVPLFVGAQTPYVSKVFEYSPAPGQFVNVLPAYEEGDTQETMNKKAEEALKSIQTGTISLGAWGGYVVFGFDHDVINYSDKTDFRIYGNAFYSDRNNPSKGGSSEPGVVYVSKDDNLNGVPDDEWYELAGSEYNNSRTDYSMTYFRTPQDHTPTPIQQQDIIDSTYIRWNDIDGQSGYIAKNRYHLQDYYPQWTDKNQLTFSGTRLPDNAQLYIEDGINKYIMYIYDFGYADNQPNDTEGSELDIDWAVNGNGEKIHLESINFVKVMTGVNQQCGWIGELSTEVSGAEDLNFISTRLNSPKKQNNYSKILNNSRIYIIRGDKCYDIWGNVVLIK